MMWNIENVKNVMIIYVKNCYLNDCCCGEGITNICDKCMEKMRKNSDHVWCNYCGSFKCNHHKHNLVECVICKNDITCYELRRVCSKCKRENICQDCIVNYWKRICYDCFKKDNVK